MLLSCSITSYMCIPTTAITSNILILVPLDFPSDVMGKFWIMVKCTFVLVCRLSSKQNLGEKYFDKKKKKKSSLSYIQTEIISNLYMFIPYQGILSLRPRNLQRPKNKRRQDKKCQSLIISVGNTSSSLI